MCYAILRVKYKSTTEQPALLVCETEEEFNTKVDEVVNRPEVQKVVWFFPTGGKELVTRWEVVHIARD